MKAGMYFQDRYNFDVERVKRCAIPYSTLEGIFPFCTYNSGPMYRQFVEQIHSGHIDMTPWSITYEFLQEFGGDYGAPPAIAYVLYICDLAFDILPVLMIQG